PKEKRAKSSLTAFQAFFGKPCCRQTKYNSTGPKTRSKCEGQARRNVMLRAYVGRAFGLRQGRILPILQRSEARLRGTVTDAALVDFASRVDRPLRDEIIAVGCDVRHADTVQPVPSVAIFPPANTGNDVAAPAATGSPFPKGKPGPNRVEEHRRFARHAQNVFGDDLPTLPPKLFLD